MELWLDIHLSPTIGAWITRQYSVPAVMMRDLGFAAAEDDQLYIAARRPGVVIVTKDADFLGLLERLGPPPQILLLRCGNTSNQRLREIFSATLGQALDLLGAGEPLVELGAFD
jgi:predicted nuclease of predicted toxin-antitoxin system